MRGGNQLKKTHCPQGHPYDDENTYMYPDGKSRGCRTCRAASAAKVALRRRAERVPKRCLIDECDGKIARDGYCSSHYFESKIQRTDGCWLWVGYISPSTGYGAYQQRYAHRLSYERYVGPIPDGLQIDHLCRNRACVNPGHLEAVPQRVNIIRGNSPGAIAVRTNRCGRGHEFTPENTYIRPDGKGRQCRACRRIRDSKGHNDHQREFAEWLAGGWSE